MQMILRSNDPVLISYARSLLEGFGLDAMEADTHMSVLEGSIGVLPRRILVADDDVEKARGILKDAGLAEWLTTE